MDYIVCLRLLNDGSYEITSRKGSLIPEDAVDEWLEMKSYKK